MHVEMPKTLQRHGLTFTSSDGVWERQNRPVSRATNAQGRTTSGRRAWIIMSVCLRASCPWGDSLHPEWAASRHP